MHTGVAQKRRPAVPLDSALPVSGRRPGPGPFLRRAAALLPLVALTLACLAGTARGAEVRVAVASNFAPTLDRLAERFEAATGHRVILARGSTGKHYAQIRNGAPFHLFFAADARRPRLLEEAGLTVAETGFTYALGRLVLWSPIPGYVDAAGRVLEEGDYRHLAIANPRLAPYGEAAREVLVGLGLWEDLQGRLVRGENIAQAYQFVASGSAELGLVALSQIERGEGARQGSLWQVPAGLYTPIEQQAVLLEESEAARSLMALVRSGEGRALIRRAGYTTP